jgi:hypothetical protein
VPPGAASLPTESAAVTPVFTQEPVTPADPKVAAVLADVDQYQQRFAAEPVVAEAAEIDPFDLPVTDGVQVEAVQVEAVQVQASDGTTLLADSTIEPHNAIEPHIVIEPLPTPQPIAEPASEAELASFDTTLAAPGRETTAAAMFDRLLQRQIAGETVDQAHLDHLLPSEKRAILTVAEHVADFRGGLSQSLDVEDHAKPIFAAADALRQQVGLTLPTAALCREVRLFGDYDPIGPNFPVGRKQRVILYVEAEGFTSQKLPDDRYLTRLSLSAVLYDEEGRPVMSLPPRRAEDTSRRQRRDFFLSGLLTLPAHALPGRHRLKVTVRDELAGRVAQQSVLVNFISR